VYFKKRLSFSVNCEGAAVGCGNELGSESFRVDEMIAWRPPLLTNKVET